MIKHKADAEDPAYVVTWTDRDGTVIDFSDPGYTFQLVLKDAITGEVAYTKTSNITGHATAPNVQCAWTTNELAALPITPHGYELHLRATIGGRNRDFRPGNEEIMVLESP